MTEHTDNGLNLGNFVFDDNNQERQSWKCFGQTCNRSLVVFLSQFFVILLILACCIVRITLAETCEETTVWIAILSTTDRDIELQNTHIVLFKSPRDVLQINTLSQQLGLGSQLKIGIQKLLQSRMVTYSLI